uniref:Uncharacterized protein n=1 Tax=Oryza glumipatula TaxID=40148 RepID=A0A0E0B1K9_9ORYZ
MTYLYRCLRASQTSRLRNPSSACDLAKPKRRRHSWLSMILHDDYGCKPSTMSWTRRKLREKWLSSMAGADTIVTGDGGGVEGMEAVEESSISGNDAVPLLARGGDTMRETVEAMLRRARRGRRGCP